MKRISDISSYLRETLSCTFVRFRECAKGIKENGEKQPETKKGRSVFFKNIQTEMKYEERKRFLKKKKKNSGDKK